MTDHDDRWYLRDGEVMRQAADGSIHRYRDALDADDHASVRRLIEDRDALTAMLDDVRESLADHYAAGVRGPLVDDLIACLGHPGDPSGVPGGGEPQPTTSTDNDPLPIDLVRELRDAVGLFSGAMPITPRQAWGEAIAVAKRAVRERDAFEAALVALDPTAAQRPVRSAGGGDQPDTPCPECNGKRWVVVPHVDPNGEPNPDLDPCPVCADKENPTDA